MLTRFASRRLRPRLRRALSTEKDSLLSFHEAVATSMNATARLLGVTHRVRVEENRSFIDKRSSFHFKITFTPPTLHNAAEHS